MSQGKDAEALGSYIDTHDCKRHLMRHEPVSGLTLLAGPLVSGNYDIVAPLLYMMM